MKINCTGPHGETFQAETGYEMTPNVFKDEQIHQCHLYNTLDLDRVQKALETWCEMVGANPKNATETIDSTEECVNCNRIYGLHRATDFQCPKDFDEHGWSHGWLDTVFRKKG
jgi:hypothetical protein